MELDLPVTAILATVAALLTTFFGFMGTRPMNPKKGPRMVPWTFFMLLTFTATMFLIVHVLNLLGVQTAPPPQFPKA